MCGCLCILQLFCNGIDQPRKLLMRGNEPMFKLIPKTEEVCLHFKRVLKKVSVFPV